MLGAGLVPIPIVGHGFTGTLPNVGTPGGPVAAPDALGSAWADVNYVTRILQTLRAALKDADPTPLTTMNFHTDIRDEMMAFFQQPTWMQSQALWRFQMDVIGVDAYPNYYRAAPVRGAEIGDRIAQIQPYACGVPIVVVETGYPTGPAEEGFDEAKQAQYLRESYDAAVAAGASGFLGFGARTADHHTVVITPQDLANLNLVADAYENGDVNSLVNFLFLNLAYMQTHFTQVLQAVEPYWGIVRPDGSHKPAWDVMADIVAGR